MTPEQIQKYGKKLEILIKKGVLDLKEGSFKVVVVNSRIEDVYITEKK